MISKTLKPSEKRAIENAPVFVAIIMENFVKDPSRYDACKYAEEHKKIMYAVIEDDVNWKRFEKFNWRKKFFTPLVTPRLLEALGNEIKRDINFFKATGGT